MAERGCNAGTSQTVVDGTQGATLPTDRLLAYYRERGRDLPWRQPDASPWAVLVSEIMLQQTPVARVLPIYLDWMQRWPTAQALAAADTADVLRAWGRLGYPRRALRLKEAAAAVVRDHDGVLPSDVPGLLALPGVGEYTARAVAAFAYGARVPVVDTNVRRVLSRAIRGIDEHGPATSADRADVERLLPNEPAVAAEVSVALMELGALTCTAGRPDCTTCPLRQSCAWRAAGYPPGPPRRRPAQQWHGTDRKMRGEILAVLRGADRPLTLSELAELTPSAAAAPEQWRRCLDSLAADGLAVQDRRGRVSLP